MSTTPDNRDARAFRPAVPGSDAGPFTLVLRLPATADQVARARRELRCLAERAGMNPSRCADVALAVGEICANVVVHAYRDREVGSFVVRAHGADGHLDVRVADDGRGLAPRSDSPGAGYGLPLVAAIASSLQLRPAGDGGTEVRMTFDA